MPQRLNEPDRGVLDGCDAFDLDIALGSHGQIEAGVDCPGGQHVVVERHTGVAWTSPVPSRLRSDAMSDSGGAITRALRRRS